MSNASGPARQVVLVVLDGWGYRPEREGNAIELARTPVWHRLWGSEPRTLLEASGLAVGLPEGQMGNSEVGHLNLGAGRVVPQDLVRISASIRSGEFFRLEPLVALCTGLRERGGTLHLARPARRRAACTPSTPICWRRWSWRSGSACRASRSTASSTAATPRPSRAPTWSQRLQADLRADRRPARRHRVADRPVLRHGPRQALGAHPAGVRRDGAGRRPRRRPTRCRRCGTPTSAARPTSSSSRSSSSATARRWRRSGTATAIFFFNYRSDRMRQIVPRRSRSRGSTGSTPACGRRCPGSSP